MSVFRSESSPMKRGLCAFHSNWYWNVTSRLCHVFFCLFLLLLLFSFLWLFWFFCFYFHCFLFPCRFFVLLLVYLIAGLLYQRYRKGVESLPEMIPNYSFWADFPFLIKVSQMGHWFSYFLLYLLHRRPKLTIREIDQILMIYIRVSSKAPSTLIRFQTKTELFCSGYGYRPHYNAENDHRKRSHLRTLSRVERFENDAFWKRCFLVWTVKTMLSENGDVIKTTRPWVSKMVDRRYHVASISRQFCEPIYWNAHASSSFDHAHWGYNSVFKQIRRCSVDGRKRYENDKCGRKSFWKRSCFAPDTAIVHTTTPKTIAENGAIRKRSPEWSCLKTMLFENAVF